MNAAPCSWRVRTNLIVSDDNIWIVGHKDPVTDTLVGDSLAVDFKSQQDRVLAAILRQQEGEALRDRPEFSDPDFDFLKPGGEAADPGAPTTAPSLQEIPFAPPPPAEPAPSTQDPR